MQVLITGASGLIGRRLTEKLLEQNFNVVHLSRKKYSLKGIQTFFWNPAAGKMDEKSLENTEVIINLAGENIVEKPFSDRRKSAIINSRTQSAQILKRSLEQNQHSVKVVINASAIGFYKKNTNEWMMENSPSGNDFISDVVNKWEDSAQVFEKMNLRTVILRIGNVLSPKGGAFSKLFQPICFFIEPVMGNGMQQFSWIHIDDLCEIIIKAIQEEKFRGTFNAVSPDPVSNVNFMDEIKETSNRFALKIKIPAFCLKLILGERSDLLLDGIKVSPQKIVDYGFQFKYPTLKEAIKNLLLK